MVPAASLSLSAFWALVARVEGASKGDLERACEAFRIELHALDDASLIEAEGNFSDLMRRAHDYGLWGAAYVIHGGCSDDGFWDFRAGLIALGERVYEAALANPDSLAEVEDIEDRTLFEGFQYVPGEALEARKLIGHKRGHHQEPVSGTSWHDDEELRDRYPRLSVRFA